jgi:prepilin signal peptidase PulO-like enzyme (type II secretory pathway)
MRITRRDALATVVFAAILVPYVGYLIRGSMPFIEDPRGMAGVGLVGLALSLVVWDSTTKIGQVLFGLGLAALGLGIAALTVGGEGNETLLAAFIGSIGLVWALETLYHSGIIHGTPLRPRHT